jgi:hypothetical protein
LPFVEQHDQRAAPCRRRPPGALSSARLWCARYVGVEPLF